MTKSKLLTLLTIAVVAMMPLTGCGSDEPEPEGNGSHRPSGGNGIQQDENNGQQTGTDPKDPTEPQNPDDPSQGNEDPSQSENPDNPADLSPIVGRWRDNSGNEEIEFLRNGLYNAYLPNSEKPSQSNTYIYDDTSRFLSMTVNTAEMVYNLEYRCLIEGNNMTLITETGKTSKLRRIAS